MSNLGLVLGLGARQTVGIQVPLGALSPSSDWDGSEGSGFTSTPTDPTRTTAKPFLRLLTPPHQAFTDTLLVGVYAGANYQDSLLDNMGLDKVTFYYEGNSLDITTPTVQTFLDVNGNSVSYFGWWVTLENSGTNGLANLYVEAFPKDSTMQNRVIGPHRFAPSATLFDAEVTVNPDLPESAGVNYQTLSDAIIYHRGNGSLRPRITIAKAGDYDPGTQAANYAPECRLVVDASVSGVVIKEATYNHTTGQMNARVNGFEYRGSNLTVDMVNSIQIARSPGLGGANTPSHWFNGCNVTCSGGQYYLVRGRNQDVLASYFVQGDEWCITECTVSNMHRFATNALIARGNNCTDLYNDQFNGTGLAIGNTVNGLDSSDYYNEVDAFTVEYTGSGAAATLEMTGSNNGNNRILYAKVDGATVGSFTVKNDFTSWDNDVQYWPSHVVDWLNGLTNWTATLIDNTRFAASLQSTGTEGAWGPVDVKTSVQTIKTAIRLHTDLWQTSSENYIFVQNLAYNMVDAQALFMKDSTSRDVLAANNLLHEITPGAQTVGKSQLAEPHSHVVWVNNTLTSQGITVRPDIGYTADAYCLIANNAVPSLQWLGTPDTDLVISDNHLFTGASIPSGATGTTTGGDKDSWASDPENGDFTVTGELLTNLKTPVLALDHNNTTRDIPAPAGGKA